MDEREKINFASQRVGETFPAVTAAAVEQLIQFDVTLSFVESAHPVLQL